MTTLRLNGRITEAGTLELELPPAMPAGQARVTIEVPAPGAPQPEAGTVEDFLAGPRDRRFIRSKEEIDDYLRTERNSWE